MTTEPNVKRNYESVSEMVNRANRQQVEDQMRQEQMLKERPQDERDAQRKINKEGKTIALLFQIKNTIVFCATIVRLIAYTMLEPMNFVAASFWILLLISYITVEIQMTITFENSIHSGER